MRNFTLVPFVFNVLSQPQSIIHPNTTKAIKTRREKKRSNWGYLIPSFLLGLIFGD